MSSLIASDDSIFVMKIRIGLALLFSLLCGCGLQLKEELILPWDVCYIFIVLTKVEIFPVYICLVYFTFLQTHSDSFI